jgi:hypothetical protein
MRNSKYIPVVFAALALMSCGGSDDNGTPPGGPGTVPTSSPTSSPSPSANRVKEGVWGGDQSALTVQSDGAQYRRDCQTGQVTQPMLMNDDGTFNVEGTINQKNGGPISPDDQRPATYSGRVTDDHMDLTIAYTDSDGVPHELHDSLTFGFEGPVPGICPL